jgi:hypothetical protein
MRWFRLSANFAIAEVGQFARLAAKPSGLCLEIQFASLKIKLQR